MASLYESDYVLWASSTAQALREGRLEGLDFQILAEEIEDLGISHKRALESRLVQLMAHLLKWDYQPTRRSRSWQGSINRQRIEVTRILAANPSLGTMLQGSYLEEIYTVALQEAVAQTNMAEESFPEKLPYSKDFLLAGEKPVL